MRVNRSIIALAAAFSLSVFGLSGQASAAVIADKLLGKQDLGNAGDSTELSALAGILGVDVSSLSLDLKLTNADTGFYDDISAVLTDKGDGFAINVSPEMPGYFILKFQHNPQTPPGGVTHYFFENIDELTQLVWANSQVDGITGLSGCNSCQLGKLSHYVLIGDSNNNNNFDVPLPAALPLLGGGIAILGFVGTRKRRWSTKA